MNDPRWTFACSRCQWRGNDPTNCSGPGIPNYCDCPECGNSCTSDEPEFEPEPEIEHG